MTKALQDFQIFAKPTGSICNLDCHYCYYLKKEDLYPDSKNANAFRMTDEILEKYIQSHIEASPEEIINFSWHGGEPTLLGIDYFKRIVELQRKHIPSGTRITNGIQTNGTLITQEWCDFFTTENFSIGLSLDGPEHIHDKYRLTKGQGPSFEKTRNGLELLQKNGIILDILCVVNSHNVKYPLEVYNYFKEIGALFISFLPLVERDTSSITDVNERTVPAEDFGKFLCTIFDEWVGYDIGKVKIQIFEEAARTAFNQEHSLCIFRKTCGDIPVVEHNGDFYSCDHYVEPEYLIGNVSDKSIGVMMNCPEQRKFGQDKKDSLPKYCLDCKVLDMCNGGCPKNRFHSTPNGESGLNYLCVGYKMFFNHCKPFVEQIAAAWRQQQI